MMAKAASLDVVFRVFPEGDVIALFPSEKERNLIMSYQHLGQHSLASPELVRELRPATPSQYAHLLAELRGLGYHLRVEKERSGSAGGASHHATRRSSRLARILRSDGFGRLLEVRAPAVHLVKLPVGAEGKNGPITKYTPDWERASEKKIANDVRLEGARQSGHDIEGHVRLSGKRYSAFTSGGPDDFVIIVRNYKEK
jgi:hypothetical protein